MKTDRIEEFITALVLGTAFGLWQKNFWAGVFITLLVASIFALEIIRYFQTNK